MTTRKGEQVRYYYNGVQEEVAAKGNPLGRGYVDARAELEEMMFKDTLMERSTVELSARYTMSMADRVDASIRLRRVSHMMALADNSPDSAHLLAEAERGTIMPVKMRLLSAKAELLAGRAVRAEQRAARAP